MCRFRPLCLIVLTLSALAALLALPSSASAVKPTREIIQLPADFVLEGVCAFPVLVHSDGQVVVLTWTDDSGDLVMRQNQLFPGSSQTFTNEETGVSVVFDLPGPGFLQSYRDGSIRFVATGPWSWYPLGPAGQTGIFVTRGRWIVSTDADGNSSFSIVGSVVDVCAELAG